MKDYFAGGADCADIVNSRPTSLGLLLKMVAIMRDQPDTFKAEFLNNLADLNDLATEELQYMLAYRWELFKNHLRFLPSRSSVEIYGVDCFVIGVVLDFFYIK